MEPPDTQTDVQAETLAFWRHHLEGVDPRLSYPKDRKSWKSDASPSGRCDLPIEPDLVIGLQHLANETGVTLAEVLLAAFVSLLYRYTRQTDLVIAASVRALCQNNPIHAECRAPELLPLRLRLTENKSFLDLLKQIHTTLIQAKPHSDISPKAIEELWSSPDAAGKASRSLVSFVFIAQPREDGDLEPEVPGEVRPLPASDLGLVVRQQHNRLLVSLVYSALPYQAATIQWMSRQSHQLLMSAVASPESLLDDLELFTAEELALLVKWAGGEPEPHEPNLYHERFQTLAHRHSERLALGFETERLTYGELDRRANRLAHYLQELGVGPDVVVGLFMARCVEMVVAALAVFKAGGGLILLDPASPPVRLASLLERISPAVVLTQERFRKALRYSKVIAVDHDLPAWKQRPETPPLNVAKGNNIAFLFLTSGSTGEPKIVVEPYGSARKPNGTDTTERYLLKTNTGTAFTASELMAILKGGTLFIAPEGVETDLQRLVSFIGQQEITYLLATPSTLEALLSLNDLSPCRSLRTVFCIGEKISSDLKHRFFTRLSAGLLVGYGCTEARGATARCCAPAEDPGVVDVGTASNEMEVWVLDAKRRLAPIGVPGEIYVGGQIAAGYLNDPDATAKRFVHHPFRSDPGARLFRTGDQGRWLPNGTLEVLGRLDNQVKIRGFRVELEEIEAVLSQHPQVQTSVVVVPASPDGDKRLVAVVVRRAGLDPQASELRQYLEQRLPGPMIPSAILFLDSLPWMPNGKLDRQALANLAANTSTPAALPSAPRNLLEHRLLDLWEKNLGQTNLRPDDNFFDLGGHSLSAARLLADLERLIGRPVPLNTLLHAPTPARLTQAIENAGAVPGWSSLVPLQPRGTKPPLFLIHGWAGDVSGLIPLARRLGNDQPVYGLQAVGWDGKQPRQGSVTEMAAHYCQEMRSLQPSGPYFVGGYSCGGIYAMEVAHQLLAQKQSVGLLLIIDTHLAHPEWFLPWPELMSRKIRHCLKSRWPVHRRELSSLSWKGKAAYLIQKARSLSSWFGQTKSNRLAHPTTTKEIEHPIDGPLETDYFAQIAGRYHPKSYPGPITLLRAQDEIPLILRDIARDWSYLAKGGLRIRQVPGKHLGLWDASVAPHWAEQIRHCLATAQNQSDPP